MRIPLSRNTQKSRALSRLDLSPVLFYFLSYFSALAPNKTRSAICTCHTCELLGFSSSSSFRSQPCSFLLSCCLSFSLRLGCNLSLFGRRPLCSLRSPALSLLGCSFFSLPSRLGSSLLLCLLLRPQLCSLGLLLLLRKQPSDGLSASSLLCFCCFVLAALPCLLALPCCLGLAVSTLISLGLLSRINKLFHS